MRVKLDLQLFAGDISYLNIYSNDGNTLLSGGGVFEPIQITSTGLSDARGNAVYTYAGGKNFVGLALNANATTPDYAIGSQVDSQIATTYYIVEQEGVPYEHIYKDNHKVQVDSAIRDGNGVKIDTNYAKKSELPDVSGKMDKANPTGTGSFSLNRASNTVVGNFSFASGMGTTASGNYSHAECFNSSATEFGAHAEGDSTTASGEASHAEGNNTRASGLRSHAEGSGSEASGTCSHAEGTGTGASGNYSHSEGNGTSARSKSQHVFGEYNVIDENGTATTRGNYVEIVGNGTGSSTRSNARTLDWSGNEVLAGSQTATSFIKSGGTSSQFLKADGSVDSSSYLTQHQDISSKQDKTDSSLQTTATTVVGAINEVNSLAKQSNKAKGFANYSALITELNSASATAYNIGQSFYIQTLNVPDLWIISVQSSSSSYTYSTDSAFITATSASGGQQVGYYKIAQLETQKVDLTNYSTKAETVSNVSYNSSSRKLQKTINGTTSDVVTFGANAFNSTTIPTKTSDLTNDSGYTTNTGTITKVQLNGTDVASSGTANIQALPNYSITIGSTNGGNPRQVKFLSVNYTNYDGNNACFIKLGAMCSHGNGVSYTFLDDIFIGVSSTGTVTCNVYKFFQFGAGNLDSAYRYYGDVFYTIDTTNKVVDFYILIGQWSTANFTPYTKIGATTSSGITQLSGSPTYYSSGTRVWANGDSITYARLSDINDVVIIDALGYTPMNPDTFPSKLRTYAYPVGSIYLSIDNTSPASFIGGTWVQLDANYALWTASSGAGNTISAGLPNITGKIGRGLRAYGETNYTFGALYGTDRSNSLPASGNYGAYESINFDASRSNSIYGNSSTVQPPAYKVYAWRRTA